MASILFIAPVDLGETVLALGALDAALKPGDTATIVCGADAAALFRALPNLKALHRIEAKPRFTDWWALYLVLAREKFDRVIDARETMLGRMRGAPSRPRSLVLRHRVEEWTDWTGADSALAPKLWIDDAARAEAASMVPDGLPLLALAPGGVSAPKRWASERFAAVSRRLVDGPLAGARVVLLGAAPRDADLTRTIAASLDADGVQALDLGQGRDLMAAAALLERATLCIGNDNALTQIAAAMGAPTLTLFGPTDERVRAPYGVRARTLRGRDYEAIMGLSALETGSLLDDISVDAVEAAAQDLLRAGGLL